MRPYFRITLTALALTAGLAGLAVAQPYAPPPYAPVPPLRAEMVPPPPAGRFLWEPGHWRWDGRAYVWTAGRYIPVRPRHAHFVPGYWAHRGHGWVWVPAHWQ